jgi:hypothetical protein
LWKNLQRKVVNGNQLDVVLETVVRRCIKHFIKIEEAHMSLKKTVAIAAAAGALAAISVPAMAFENEFHGIYNLKFFVSNYENGSAVTIDPTAFNHKNKANNFFEQRARLQYTAKASDDLKLVTQFELDSKFGGDKTGKYGVSSDAGVFDADGINLETKHVFLDFNLGKSVNVKTGIQPIKDSLKGIFLDADLAGVLATSKIGAATVTGGYFRYKTESSNGAPAQPTATSYNTNTSPLGHDNADIFILDGKFAATKNLNVGALYYLLSDYSTNTPTTIHLFGLNADAKVGPATVSGFVAAQTGFAATAQRKAISGYAANVGAKMPVGPGTVKASALFLSGDGNANNNNNTAWNSTGSSTYVEGGQFLLIRTGIGGTNNDRTITGATLGSNKGLIAATAGYDATITPKLYANANVGALWAAKNTVANNGNASNFRGAEINLETGYKVYDNLTAKVQVAYVFLGGFYKHAAADADPSKSPEDPYTARIGLSYAF